MRKRPDAARILFDTRTVWVQDGEGSKRFTEQRAAKDEAGPER
jgi:hypothetical protein